MSKILQSLAGLTARGLFAAFQCDSDDIWAIVLLIIQEWWVYVEDRAYLNSHVWNPHP